MTNNPSLANANATCKFHHSAVAQFQMEHPQAFLTMHLPLFPTSTSTWNAAPGTTRLCVQTQQIPTAHYPSLCWPTQVTTWSVCSLLTHRGWRDSPPTIGIWSRGLKRPVMHWGDCSDTTDWEVLCRPHEQDIDKWPDCITYYVNFCGETTMSTMRVKTPSPRWLLIWELCC